jgi:DNA-binding transcriptional ArsR family regulator
METSWRFITNHARILAFIDYRETVTVRQISDSLGLAEPSVRRIISELIDDGYVHKELHGRVNRYFVSKTLPLKAPECGDVTVGELLNTLDTPRKKENAI